MGNSPEFGRQNIYNKKDKSETTPSIDPNMPLISYLKRKAMGFYVRQSQKRLNLWRTFVINFYFLPWNQARKLPIFVYGKMRMSKAVGRIVIDCPDTDIAKGMIRLNNNFDNGSGAPGGEMAVSLGAGEIRFLGPVSVGYNTKILLWGGGRLTFGRNTIIACSGNIACCNQLEIGDCCRIGPGSTITDSNYHFTTANLESPRVKRISAPVILGHNCWTGAGSSIMKGVNLPDYTTVASNSLVNKSVAPHQRCLIGGAPAKLLKEGFLRVFNTKKEAEIASFFAENPDACEYPLQLPLEQYD